MCLEFMSAIFTVTALPFGLLIVITGIVGILGSADSAISAFGGLAVVLPTVLFTGLAFRHAGARNAGIVRSFLGESLKLVLTAGLLVCVFVWVTPWCPAQCSAVLLLCNSPVVSLPLD